MPDSHSVAFSNSAVPWSFERRLVPEQLEPAPDSALVVCGRANGASDRCKRTVWGNCMHVLWVHVNMCLHLTL